ncbi:MAG: RHS repeat domain-containing protein [Blastocatellia bacterium]
MRKRNIGTITVLMIVVSLTALRGDARQGGTTRFVYDDNGRLTAVISPNGEAAVYEYDAAGNFTAIRRISAAVLTLMDFFPREGGAGDQITFVGTGFNAGVSSVSFNGASAQITSVSPSAVVAVVPDSASSGPVTIVTPRGTLVTPFPFTIVARVRVVPSAAILLPGEAIAFTAFLGGGQAQTVIWSVNGDVGGNNTNGLISAAGLYTAPLSLSGNASLAVTVRASSAGQSGLFGEAMVKVLNPNSLGMPFANSISIRRGDTAAVKAARTSLLSVRRGSMITGPSIALTPMVSVRFGIAAGSAAAVFSRFVSVTTGPAVSSILPASLARSVTVTVTINGENLAGASALRFITASGSIDTAIAASNVVANAEGTQVTAAVTVSSAAATGIRVIVVTASSGTTLAVQGGANTITIQ